jgi:hypothetical protein
MADNLQQKTGSAYVQSLRKCSKIELLAKIEKYNRFFKNILTKVVKGFDLRKKYRYFMLVYFERVTFSFILKEGL